MAISLEPVQPWPTLVTAVVGIASIFILVRFIADRWKIVSSKWLSRIVVLIFSLLAGGALVLAVWNPVIERNQNPGSVHLVIVVDVSDSVLRIEGGWQHVQAQITGLLHKSLDDNIIQDMGDDPASLINFRINNSTDNVTMETLIDAVNRLDPSRFASGDGTNISSGLARARVLLEKSGGRGAILLATDGNETTGDALAAAQEIARLGTPITVLPLEGGNPEQSLTSLDLAGQVDAGKETTLRGVVWNRSNDETDLAIRIDRNKGLDQEHADLFGPSLSATSDPTHLSSRAYFSIRPEIVFQGAGLQYLDVLLLDKDGMVLHRRRLFTTVDKPISLLAIAGDNNWVAAVPNDSFTVTQIEPGLIDSYPELEKFDAVVISNVLASQFSTDQLERLAAGVEESAIGLFFINGGHQYADEETETVLRSYTGTPLDRVLPVSTEPRPETPEPPPRHVVMVIDASGSMEGWKLEKAKEIAKSIVTHLLRPQDILDVIAFTVGVAHIVDSRFMDTEGVQYATSQILSLQAGGGTDPTEALQQIAGRQLTNCGLVFISDGEFENVTIRPDCRATVFAIQETSIPSDSPLFELADPFVASQNFSPAGITIPFFEPEKRDKFFERGAFSPLSMATALAKKDYPLVPNIKLEGSAVSYPRPGTELIALRPKLIDPVLVYGQAGEGYIGVFTSELTDEWIDSVDGQAAIQDWLKRVVARADSDRYSFQVEDDGTNLHVCIEVRGEDFSIPEITHLSVQIDIADRMYAVPMAADNQTPSSFCGVASASRNDKAQPAQLIITESGVDALARPQRIPLLIPPLGRIDNVPNSEANTYGVNVNLLTQIAEISGGEYAPENGVAFFNRSVVRQDTKELWPWLLVLSAVFYLLAIGIRRASI